jgi:hypothetical protein
MSPRPSPVAVAVAIALAAPAAVAQTTPIRLSVERAFGAGYSEFTASSSTTVGGATVTRESTASSFGLSFFGEGHNAAATTGNRLPLHQPPRLAIDLELSSRLTIGASVFFAYGKFTEQDGDGASSTAFGLAPRVGYWLGLGDRFALWPRVGVSFANASTSPVRAGSSGTTTSTTSYTTLSLNLEPTAAFMLASQFGITAGVVIDVPLVGDVTTVTTVTSGSARTEATVESSAKQRYIGLQFGVMGRF